MSTFLGWIVAAIFIAWLLAAIHVLGCAVCEWRLRRDARRASRSYWDMRDALREEGARLKAEEAKKSTGGAPKPRKPRDPVDAEPSRRLIKPKQRKRDDTDPLPEYLLRKDRL